MVVRDQHRCIRFMVRGLGRAFLCWRAACSGISEIFTLVGRVLPGGWRRSVSDGVFAERKVDKLGSFWKIKGIQICLC